MAPNGVDKGMDFRYRRPPLSPSNELGNLYAMLLGKQVHDGYADQTGKRPFVHAATGYIGIQQYAAMESGKSNSRGR